MVFYLQEADHGLQSPDETEVDAVLKGAHGDEGARGQTFPVILDAPRILGLRARHLLALRRLRGFQVGGTHVGDGLRMGTDRGGETLRGVTVDLSEWPRCRPSGSLRSFEPGEGPLYDSRTGLEAGWTTKVHTTKRLGSWAS